jgi:Skp family chaperone for outer membrane proteins
MKRSLTLICVLASGIGVSAMAQTSPAADPTPSAPAPVSAATAAPAAVPAGPAKVAVIMFQTAVAQTNEGIRDFTELRKKFEPKQAQLKSQSDEIESMKKQIQTQSSTLSEAERVNRTKSIDDKEKALQRTAEDAQNDFQTEMNDTYQQLAEKVYQVLQGYVQQSGYTLVVDASTQQSPILWAIPSSDITKAVIDAYNAKSGVPAQPTPAAGPASSAPRSPSAPRPAPKTATPAPK